MGDDACFLKYTCIECGQMLELADRARTFCPRCGADIEKDEVPLLTKPAP